jgi:hypothetical protein
MTFTEWWNREPPLTAFFKDCLILDFDVVSERYVLLTLQIPLPVGGTHGELVAIDGLIVDVE